METQKSQSQLSNSPSVDSQQENLEIHFYGIDFQQIVILERDRLWVDDEYVLLRNIDVFLGVLIIIGEDFVQAVYLIISVNI